MAYSPNNSNGQKTMANSAPIVIASDQASIPVASTLSAETTKVIGVVRTSDGSGNLITSTSQALDINIKTSAALPAGTNIIGKTGIDQTTVGTTNAISIAQIGASTVSTGNGASGTGNLRVNIASDNTAFPVNATLQTGSNIVGKVGIDQTTKGTTNGVTLVPATTGGFSTYHLVSAASTNLNNIKASAGQVFGWYIYNSNAAARKVAFHNVSGTPTAGTSIFMTLIIPPNAGANVMTETGIAFSTGIAISTVTDLNDAGSTSVGLNDLNINIFYI